MSQTPTRPINIVLDLETLGTAEDSAILQIGCAIPSFDWHKLDGISPFFVATIAYEQAINSEFSKDSDTLDWWEKQSVEARKVVFSGQDSYEDALDQFKFWIETLKSKGLEVNLWGNGPEFDNRLLDYTLRSYNISGLWSFRNNHSMRTARLFFPVISSDNNYIKHTALDDAKYEADLLDQMYDIYTHAQNVFDLEED